jgi:hypothetical protein
VYYCIIFFKIYNLFSCYNAIIIFNKFSVCSFCSVFYFEKTLDIIYCQLVNGFDPGPE